MAISQIIELSYMGDERLVFDDGVFLLDTLATHSDHSVSGLLLDTLATYSDNSVPRTGQEVPSLMPSLRRG